MSDVSYHIHIVCTAKSRGKNQEDYHIFEREDHNFKTEDEAKQFICDKYGKCKRDKMYKDLSDGEVLHIGYIYCFANDDISHSPVQKWWQQDWVTIEKVLSDIVYIF